MSPVRAYKIPVEVIRGNSVESHHVVYAAACNTEPSDQYECDLESLPNVWMRSTAKPFQLLPLLLQPQGRAALDDPRDIAVSVGSHSGTEAHATRVRDILERQGLGTELLRCGVHWPYFLHQLRPDEMGQGQTFTELHNNCSGNHAAMLHWARLQGVPIEAYLDPTTPAQQTIHRLIEAVAGTQPSISVDNCGSPCYQLPLQNVAIAYLTLAGASDLTIDDAATSPAYAAILREQLADLGPFDSVLAQLDAIGAAMASHPEWVSGEETEATVLAKQFPDCLAIKHGAEGVLCLAHRRAQASVALKVMDGNSRALFPALLRLMQEFGWLDPDSAGTVADLAEPRLQGPPGHFVGGLRAARGTNGIPK